MTTKLIWRLKEQPSTQSLQELVTTGILTKEEARQILFSSENEDERDKKSLEAEIKFLRELVEKLSTDRTKIVEVIREVQKPYKIHPWYQPYQIWCGNGVTTYTSGSALNTTNAALTSGTMGLASQQYAGTTATNFSSIQTF